MVSVLKSITLDEALEIRKNTKVIPFAGGTDLMVRRRGEWGTLPKFEYPALFIGGIDQLKQISQKDNVLTIGSAVTLVSIIEHELVPEILKKAVSEMASPAIRNMGTIGGNICNASPAGDTLPVLYALGAKVVLQSSSGRRELCIAEFIESPGRTDLKEDELLVEIKIPLENFNSIYYKKVGTRKADALSKLSFAGVAKVENGILQDVRMAFGAVSATIVRVEEAENLLKGKKVEELPELINDVKRIYENYIKPIHDQRSNAVYRKTVSLRLMEHFIGMLLTRGN